MYEVLYPNLTFWVLWFSYVPPALTENILHFANNCVSVFRVISEQRCFPKELYMISLGNINAECFFTCKLNL
jgi:hypothetical protein